MIGKFSNTTWAGEAGQVVPPNIPASVESIRIIESELNKYPDAIEQWEWYAGSTIQGNLHTITTVIQSYLDGDDLSLEYATVEVLKNANRKSVLGIVFHSDNSSVIVKLHTLKSVRHQLKYRNSMLDETANCIRANQRGIPVPTMYGYGCKRNSLGLNRYCVMVQEDLRPLKPLPALLEENSDSNLKSILNQTIPLFVSLYQAGCNHLDLHLDNMMLDANTSESKVFLTDFEHVRFWDKPSLEILLCEMGYFARMFQNQASPIDFTEWFQAVLGAVGQQEFDSSGLWERFCFYKSGRGIFFSKRLRRRIR